MPSGLEKSLTTRECTNYFKIVDEMNWNSFDDYIDHIYSINYVKFLKKDWLKSICSCIYWAKNYYYHHVIGLAADKK